MVSGFIVDDSLLLVFLYSSCWLEFRLWLSLVVRNISRLMAELARTYLRRTMGWVCLTARFHRVWIFECTLYTGSVVENEILDLFFIIFFIEQVEIFTRETHP